jgi:hypothetical protein
MINNYNILRGTGAGTERSPTLIVKARLLVEGGSDRRLLTMARLPTTTPRRAETLANVK